MQAKGPLIYSLLIVIAALIVGGFIGRNLPIHWLKVPAWILPLEKWYGNSVNFTIKKGRSGIIALHISSTQWHKSPNSFDYILSVSFKDGDDSPQVEMDKPWFPRPSRLGAVSYWGIDVNASGKLFASENAFAEGKTVIKDADLLCRFLVGNIELEDLEAAASLEKLEEKALAQLPRFREKISAQATEIKQLHSQLERFIKQRPTLGKLGWAFSFNSQR